MSSPEVQAATDRLERIPAQLLTPEFRAAVVQTAKAAALLRLRTEAIQRATADLEAALSVGNLDAAGAANTRRFGLEQLQLPVVGFQPDVVAEPLRLATQYVAQAEHDLGVVPTVRYLEELEDWQGLASQWHQTELPPVMTPADQEAVDLQKGMHMLRKPILEAIAAWRATVNKNPDPVAQIENALDIAAQVAEYLPKHRILAAKVEAANQTRMEAIRR